MHWTERTKLIHDRLNSYDKKKYDRKKKKSRENLNINEKVLLLAERIRKKSALGKFYKKSVRNIRKYFSLEKSKKMKKSATTG